MDASVNSRQELLLRRLKARTHRDGTPKANFKENVAAIRAELAILEEKQNGNSRKS